MILKDSIFQLFILYSFSNQDGTLEPDEENLLILNITNDQEYVWVTSNVPPPIKNSPSLPSPTPKGQKNRKHLLKIQNRL